jgi:flagellar L-ring protein precursor FlgH
MHRITAFVVALIVWAAPASSGAQSIFSDLRPTRASRVGDILTVLISENTTASNKATVKTGKTDALETKSEGFLPIPATKQDFKNTYSGDGSVVRSQQIQARVTATVVGRKDNGDLLIEGARVIEVNGEKEVIIVSGAVNPLIIPPDNTIEAFRIADLQISYKGKGVATEGSRPGFFLRLMNWLF